MRNFPRKHVMFPTNLCSIILQVTFKICVGRDVIPFRFQVDAYHGLPWIKIIIILINKFAIFFSSEHFLENNTTYIYIYLFKSKLLKCFSNWSLHKICHGSYHVKHHTVGFKMLFTRPFLHFLMMSYSQISFRVLTY